MLKKVTFCLMAILGSASALAGHADDMALPAASGVNLMAPHQEGSWSFGLQANYFEPNNDFNYAYAPDTTASLNSVTNNTLKTYAVGSDYDWGWGADITYHFPGEGRDVTLAFTQLNTSDSDSINAADDNLGSISAGGTSFLSQKGSGLFPSTTSSYDTASGKVRTNYDALDLTFGQVITAGNRITLHPFAGLRYGYIDYKATGYYTTITSESGGTPVTPFTSEEDTQTLKSTFQGAGPRLGSDAAVNLGGGFSLHGTLGVSLLVGSMDVDGDYSFISYSDASKISSIQNTDHDVETNTRVVPEADAKLSAMYHTDFNNGYGLGFEAGYQVTNYFDAIQNNTLSTFDTSSEYTDFFMQGPYARIQLDVA